MQPVGFSTGALFRDELASGVDAAARFTPDAVELSALRTRELDNLIAYIELQRLSSFKYVSIHAPTDYLPEQEAEIATRLLRVARLRNWQVIIHPDVVSNYDHWKPFGHLLCVENMDKRKLGGRTIEELAIVFANLPDATLCFDIAHAHQVDATMTEAYRILRQFGERISQMHISELTGSGKHARLSLSALAAYQTVLPFLPTNVPVILESPTSAETAVDEVQKVFALLSAAPGPQSKCVPLSRLA